MNDPSHASSARSEEVASRLLIVAAAEASGSEVREALEQRIRDGATEIRVTAPALPDRAIERVMGDIDDAIAGAEKRLQRALEEVRRAGGSAEGAVGDSDLRQAIEDALQTFAADEILIVAHAEDPPSHEHDYIADAERSFAPAITEIFVTDEGGEPHVAEVEEVGPGERQVDPDEAETRSENLPAFSPRDVLGIVVAIVGTAILFVLAANCESDGFSSFDACAARLLLAGAIALINLAHVVGLTLFQSGPYRGLGRTFFAEFSLYGTPIAILVSALLLR